MVTDNGTIYYQRGSSPYSTNAIMCGALDSTVYDASNDQKATYSETGPGVDIWAPGTDIMSSTSNTNAFSGQSYYLNSSFKQCNISGTSMGTPQAAGVAALYLEVNPKMTPAQLKSALVGNAGSVLYSTGLSNDWTNTRSLQGSAQKILYNKYNSEKKLGTSGTFTITGNIKIS
jgi:subtilisin family serine protease